MLDRVVGNPPSRVLVARCPDQGARSGGAQSMWMGIKV